MDTKKPRPADFSGRYRDLINYGYQICQSCVSAYNLLIPVNDEMKEYVEKLMQDFWKLKEWFWMHKKNSDVDSEPGMVFNLQVSFIISDFPDVLAIASKRQEMQEINERLKHFDEFYLSPFRGKDGKMIIEDS
jgi:hypothetical protein